MLGSLFTGHTARLDFLRVDFDGRDDVVFERKVGVVVVAVVVVAIVVVAIVAVVAVAIVVVAMGGQQ